MNKLTTVSITVMVVLGLSLAGCGAGDKLAASFTGNSQHCVDGVMYIQFTNGASVMYNPDGTVKTC